MSLMFCTGGWIHSVSFSGDGARVCWLSHDGSICVADANRNNAVTKLRTEHLPFLSCIWVTPNAVVAAVSLRIIYHFKKVLLNLFFSIFRLGYV